jgi:hypothetical protein
MSQQVIQVNFQFKDSVENYKISAAAIAEVFANLPGLQWKIWLINEERKEGGGIYLFADKESADNYINSALFKKISANPEFTNFHAKQFDTLGEPGIITHAPLKSGAVTL